MFPCPTPKWLVGSCSSDIDALASALLVLGTLHSCRPCGCKLPRWFLQDETRSGVSLVALPTTCESFTVRSMHGSLISCCPCNPHHDIRPHHFITPFLSTNQPNVMGSYLDLLGTNDEMSWAVHCFTLAPRLYTSTARLRVAHVMSRY